MMRKIDLAIDLSAQNDFTDLTPGQDLTFRVRHGLELHFILDRTDMSDDESLMTQKFLARKCLRRLILDG